MSGTWGSLCILRIDWYCRNVFVTNETDEPESNIMSVVIPPSVPLMIDASVLTIATILWGFTIALGDCCPEQTPLGSLPDHLTL